MLSWRKPGPPLPESSRSQLSERESSSSRECVRLPEIAPNNRISGLWFDSRRRQIGGRADSSPVSESGGDVAVSGQQGRQVHRTGSPRAGGYAAMAVSGSMGGALGPIGRGRTTISASYAPEKIPYAIDRLRSPTETNRSYGVMNKRLADRPFLAGEYSIARHGELSLGGAARAAGGRISTISCNLKALVRGKSRPPGTIRRLWTRRRRSIRTQSADVPRMPRKIMVRPDASVVRVTR